MIGTYFPFKRKGNRWGRFLWIKLPNMTFKDTSLFRKFENLNGYSLKVSMFPRYPTALIQKEIPKTLFTTYFMNVFNDSRGFGGIDGLLLGNLARNLNFSADIVEPIGADFGYRIVNETFVGK